MRGPLPFCVLLLSLFVSTGCQLIDREVKPAPVNDTPLVVDEAMQVRDWDRTTNYYANGASVAGGTGYVWEVADSVNPGHRRFIDAPVAVLNFASMPVGLFVNSPFGAEVDRGELVPPTYTGQPPLPGEPVPVNREEATDLTEPAAPPPAPDAPPTEPPPAPDAPPAVETPPAPPLEPAPPPAPVEPVTPAPSDPITPEPSPEPPPPSAAEPAAPVTPVTPDPAAPPAPPAPADPPVAPPPQ